MHKSVKVITEDIEKSIKELLESAKSSIKICVAWMNMRLYYEILQAQISKGVDIEIICNDDASNKKTMYPHPDGVRIILFKPKNGGINHNKFAIIDDNTVCTGSYNWSSNAQKNHENICIIHGDIDSVASYATIFEELKIGDKINKLSISEKVNRCKICRSNAYNLLLISYNDIYTETEYQKIYIFEICQKNKHVRKIHEETQDFSNDTFLDDPIDLNPIEEAIDQLHINTKTFEYYKSHLNIDIHATGSLGSNFNVFTKGYADVMEYWVDIDWRDPNYKNVIPDKLSIEFLIGQKSD